MTSNRSTISHAASAAILALLWLAMFLLGTGDADLAVLDALYAGDRPVLADAARLVTLLGGWYFVTPLAAVVALALGLRGRPWPALVLFIGTLAGRLLVELQKYQLGRLRPDEHPHLVNVYNLSFPSGHSANAMMVYVAMALMLADERRTFWLGSALLLSILIGLSRTMLGVHWPSDVLAGWSFGLLWAMLLAWLSRHPPS
jgi:undecaprenyl-diphosphatase